jgi:hypothetical protein
MVGGSSLGVFRALLQGRLLPLGLLNQMRQTVSGGTERAARHLPV